jgi:REP element-mobilizing transposase RayT
LHYFVVATGCLLRQDRTMPRQMRIEYPGAIYHVFSRGDRRNAIFFDDADRHDFIKILGEACQKTGFQVHAYCLMKNHFHLVVETPVGNLVAGMRWLLSTYSNRFNHRHGLCGHVFSGRYKALIVDGSSPGYLRTVCDYTHLNPVRARVLRPHSRLSKHPWSSFGLYLTKPRHRPKWLRVDRLLGEHGIDKDTDAGRRQFERRMETRRAEEGDPKQWKGMRRGWYLGPPRFHQALLKRLQGQLGPSHSGTMRRQASRAAAEAIIAQELRRLRWREADLGRRAKTDAAKVALAARLRRETTMTIGEIARRLRMGTRNTLSAKLHQWRRAHR